MPYGMTDFGSSNSDTPDYTYIVADHATIRVEPPEPRELPPLESVMATTDAVPNHQFVYYTMGDDGSVRIVEDDMEDDFEPEPTLKELVRDADWTI